VDERKDYGNVKSRDYEGFRRGLYIPEYIPRSNVHSDKKNKKQHTVQELAVDETTHQETGQRVEDVLVGLAVGGNKKMG